MAEMPLSTASGEGRILEPSPSEILKRNRQLYDGIDSAVWRMAVFDPVYKGRRYVNMGGDRLVDELIHVLGIEEALAVLDLGCGPGEVGARIASSTGAHVTGVDINPNQIRLAHLAAAACTRGSFEPMEADAARWTPPRAYHAAYAVDTLMLLADWRPFLACALAAVRTAAGRFAATTILGEHLAAADRRYFWEQDGFVKLPPRQQAEREFVDAGFRSVRCSYHNDWAVDCLERICMALVERRPAIEAEIGQTSWQDWHDVNCRYLEAFRSGTLSYVLFLAH
jgi:cyclopropane fatty-acyl-phospholipid synthase-like methyltransferase